MNDIVTCPEGQHKPDANGQCSVCDAICEMPSYPAAYGSRAREMVGERFVTEHWRQRGMEVQVTGFSGGQFTVRVVSAGDSRREVGDVFNMPLYMLLDLPNNGKWKGPLRW